MKNIRIYNPDKYKGENYIEVKEDIYETVLEAEENDDALSLEQVTDEELLKELEKKTDWKQSDSEIEEDYLIAYYNGKKYYKDIEDEEIIIFKNMDENTEENEEDLNNSYIEFVGDSIEEIENLLSIIGKHVYNKEDGEYVKLIIE